MENKEVEQLKGDLELVTKTAKVLASKLEKISRRVEILLSSLAGVSVSIDTSMEIQESSPAVRPSPTAEQQASRPIPTPAPEAQATGYGVGSETKTGRLLDGFLRQVQSMNKGSEIANILSRLRDQVMQSAEVGFHPAFHEMGRYANQLKNIKEISEVEKEQLYEKIYDWKTRLSG
ncbi:MAG: hypothetical protein ACXAC8_11245 [Candidatus Hodarchaeales archaeon]